MWKKDIIEEAKISYDEKYQLLKKVKYKNIILELRRHKKTLGNISRYFVIASSTNSVFFTRFFANRYFNKLVKKHHTLQKKTM